MQGAKSAAFLTIIGVAATAAVGWLLRDSALRPEMAHAVAVNTICGDGVQSLDEACDDGNLVYGDGCTPNCRLEESPSVGNCEDGLDNDQDDLTDYLDPDCATLSFLQSYAMLASGAGDPRSMRRAGLRVGLRSEVHSTAPSDVLVTDPELLIADPNNLLIPEIRDPNSAVPYPYGPSKSQLCGTRTWFWKEAWTDGTVVADGDTAFGAKTGAPLVIGGMFVHTGSVDWREPEAEPLCSDRRRYARIR